MDSNIQDLDFAALYLCFTLLIVYTLQVVFDLELAYRPGVEYYRFFTSFLAHSSLEHLLNNLFFIGLFGTMYELFTDSKTFLATFFVSAFLANFTSFIFYPDTFIVGASGGAMGLLAALAVYKPRQVGLGLGVPMPMWAVLITYIFIDLVGLGGANNTANEAHLAGLLVGSFVGYRLRNPGKSLIKTEGLSNRKDKEVDQINNQGEIGDGEDDLGFDNWEQRIREWEEKYMK